MAGNSTTQVNVVNKAQLALIKLRSYFATAGRSDVISVMVDAAAGSESAEKLLAVAGLGGGETSDLSATAADRAFIENLLFLLLDNTEAAYFVKDMLKDTKLLSKFDRDGKEDETDFSGVENFVRIVPHLDRSSYETAASDAIFIGGTNGWGAVRQLSVFNLDNQGNPIPVDGGGFEQETAQGLSPDINSSKVAPTLCSFEFPNLRVSLSNRNADTTSIFLNGIPTHEMSRCVPYFEMQLITTADPGSAAGASEQFGIVSFLGTSADDKIMLSKASPKNKLATAGLELAAKISDPNYDSFRDAGINTNVSSAGMELFTSPQTMVNPSINKDSVKNIIDPLQPLATLLSFKVSMEGVGHEFHTNRTATMDFIIHDRSRMNVFAPLLSSEIFGTTTVLVEYGWSHPHGSDADENAFGSLLNSMRNVALFRVVVSNFTIQNDGQVRVTVRLATQGASDMKALPVVTGEVMPTAPFSSLLQSYASSVLSARVSAAATGDTEVQRERSLAEIRTRISVAISRASSSATVVPRVLYDALMQHIQDPGGEQDTSLSEIIAGVIGDPVSGTPGLIESSSQNMERIMRQKVMSLRGGGPANESNPDPYLGPIESPSTKSRSGYVEGERISLGKIFMSFIGYPLAASGKFDEVQLIFYRFNFGAMEARNLDSIAQYEVKYTDFQKFTVENFSVNDPGLSIQGFAEKFNERFINDPTNPNYGDISLKYKALVEATEAGATAENAAQDADAQAAARQQAQNIITGIRGEIEAMIQQEYRGSGGGEPVFSLPDVRIYLEALPAYVISDTTQTIDPSKAILRIHVYDNNATPNVDEAFLLKTLNSDMMAIRVLDEASTSEAEADERSGRDSRARSGAASVAVEEGLVQQVASVTNDQYITYVAAAPAKEIKNIIKSSMPSVTFGSQYSAITNISLNANTSGAANNVFLLRSQEESNTGAESTGDPQLQLEPMTVIPGQISMTVLGCPLIDRAQQFFIDMGTGTTADNIYIVTQVSHTISPGNFKTQLNMSFTQNASIGTVRSQLVAAYGALKSIEDSGEDVTPATEETT